MRTSQVRCEVALGVVAVLWLLGGLATAGEGGGLIRTTDRRHHSEMQPQRYYILQVLGAGGQVTFETVSDLDYKKRLKDYEEEFMKAAEDWLKARAEAKKNNVEFKDEKPKGPRLMRKLEKSFKKEEDARAYSEQVQKQWDELVAKKQAEKEAARAKEESKNR